MSEQDARNERPSRRENNEDEIVGQPMDRNDDMLDDNDPADADGVADIEAEEGE